MGLGARQDLWVDRYREAQRQLRFMPDSDVTSSSGAQVLWPWPDGGWLAAHCICIQSLLPHQKHVHFHPPRSAQALKAALAPKRLAC